VHKPFRKIKQVLRDSVKTIRKAIPSAIASLHRLKDSALKMAVTAKSGLFEFEKTFLVIMLISYRGWFSRSAGGKVELTEDQCTGI
jgi:hypothetical protein